jgi:copper chaperone
MKSILFIQNLKCSGCKHNIMRKLTTIGGIKDVFVNMEDSSVTFSYKVEDQMDRVCNELSKLGYPVVGEKNSLRKKARSYVNCAMGKVQKK